MRIGRKIEYLFSKLACNKKRKKMHQSDRINKKKQLCLASFDVKNKG